MTQQTPEEETPPVEPTGTAGDGNLAVPMKLKDFLSGVATIYDLPERLRRAARIPHPLKPKAGAKIPAARKNVLLAAAAVTSLLWAVNAIKQPPEEFGILPLAMNGGWQTSDGRYRDRNFWIQGDRIAFETGSDTLPVTIHKITQVDQKILQGDTLQYTLQYLVDGAPTTWEIQYIERPKPEIRFVHQRELAWTPAPNSPWPTP
jgi:hypothetical protein